MKNMMLFAILLCLLGFGYTSQSHVKPGSKIAKSLQVKLSEENGPFPVLVILKDQADLSGADGLSTKEEKGRHVYDKLRLLAQDSQKGLVTLLTERGAQFQKFYIINMIALDSATPDLILELAARPEVGRIINNPTVKNILPEGDLREEARGVEPSLISVGAQRVWTELNVRGENIVVAGQDTGYQWNHPALIKQYRGSSAGGVSHNFNWHDAIHSNIAGGGANPCGFNAAAPCDDNSHGTHTMGTMVGDDGGLNKIGMAPGAKWIGCRNMDRGVGRPTTYIECFQFFLAPYLDGQDPMVNADPSKSPHVINNSWGCPPDEGCNGQEFIQVLDALGRAGIMVVVSAGNSGSQCSTIMDPPATHTNLTFSVGAMNHQTGNIAYFSSRGPSKFDGGLGPDVSAPGVSIRSSVPGNGYAGGYSGTSMAGPHVVGEVALLWSAKPALIGKIAETANIIRKSATPKTSTETCGGVSGSTIPNNTYGHGNIDVYKAITTAP